MILAGITSIYFTRLKDLPGYCREISAAGVMPVILNELVKIDLAPGAVCVDSKESDSEGVQTKSSLTFLTDYVPFDAKKEHIAFVIVTSNEEIYLLGASEPPFPKVKIEKNSSTPDQGKAGFSVQIEWASPLISVYVPWISSF